MPAFYVRHRSSSGIDATAVLEPEPDDERLTLDPSAAPDFLARIGSDELLHVDFHCGTLPRHLDRFERSMERLLLSPPYGRNEIRDILIECVRLSGLRDAYAEVICTRGIPRPGSRDPRDCDNRFYAFVVPFIWIADPEKQEQGLHAVIGSKQRIAPDSVDPTVKKYHWLDLQIGLLDS